MDSINRNLANTAAAKMLAAGLRRASEERGLSLRKLGAMLNYKQAVVLSHMALGRAPIPLDRAEQLAEVLDMDKSTFLSAVLRQRHPEVDWSLISGSVPAPGDQAAALARDLESIAGRSLADLSPEQRSVIREVAADARPARRWLAVHELPVIDLIRQHRPSVREMGLDSEDRAAIEIALRGTAKGTPR